MANSVVNQDAIRKTDSPIALFVALEHARGHGDFHGAAKAQDRLAELGVIVKYGRPRPAKRRRAG